MKGIVFTEFFDMVEHSFSIEMVDNIIDDCNLETNGAYTSVGTYNHKELLQLVGALSNHTGTPVRDLVYEYGRYLFDRFYKIMPKFFEKPTNAFEFLESVHETVHVEVKKLYPDASLPNFSTIRETESKLMMVYESKCPFADFAHGLMVGCIDHYDEDISIEFEDKNTDDQYSRIFKLEKL
jgi:hypothetical protein